METLKLYVESAASSKSLNLLGSHVTRMGHFAFAAMPANVKPDPIQVGFFSTQAIVKIPNRLPALVKLTRRLQRQVAWFH